MDHERVILSMGSPNPPNGNGGPQDNGAVAHGPVLAAWMVTVRPARGSLMCTAIAAIRAVGRGIAGRNVRGSRSGPPNRAT